MLERNMKKAFIVYLMFSQIVPIVIKAEKKPWRERVGYDLKDTGFYWDFNMGVLTISGSGPMPSSYGPWDGYDGPGKNAIDKVVIEQGVTNVCPNLFAKHKNLKSVILPNSLTSIGINAFGECESLRSIIIPNRVTSIPNRTFSCCYNLESITIPNSVVSIGEEAFWACKSLEHVTIPVSVTSIGRDAFSKGIYGGVITLSKILEVNNKSYSIIVEENTIPLGGSVCRVDKKCGLKDETGKWILPLNTMYSEISYLIGNYVKVRKNNLYGLFTIEGKEIVPCEMEALESAGTGYLRFKINGFWGVMNYTGKILIDTDRGYTSIGDFKTFNKRFPYTMAGYKGECDINGKQILKIKVETPKQTVASSSSSSNSSSSSTNSSSSSNSGSGTTQTVVVEHHRDPMPVQEWQQCVACYGSGQCPNVSCGGSGWYYIGDRARTCSRCHGSGKCTICAGKGGQYVTVYR